MDNRVRLSELLYYIGVFFAVFSASVTNSSYMFANIGLPMNSIARYSALVFFLASIIARSRWKLRSIITVGFITVLSAIVVVISNDKALILYALMVLTIGKIKPIDVVRRIAKLNLIFLILVVGSSLIGFIPNDTFTHYDTTAYCLGYYYYSTCAYQVFFLTVVGYFLISGKYKKFYEILYIALSILANYITYNICTVRLTFYCFILFVALILLYKNTHLFKNNRFYRAVATWMFPVVALLTVFFSINYNKYSFIKAFDILISYRFGFNYQAFQRYPISLLGNLIETHGEEWDQNWHNLYFYIDSGYIDTLLGSGLIIFLLAIFCYTLISRMAVRENNYKLFVWCVIICVFSVLNNVFLSTCVNPLLLFSIVAINSESAELKMHTQSQTWSLLRSSRTWRGEINR